MMEERNYERHFPPFFISKFPAIYLDDDIVDSSITIPCISKWSIFFLVNSIFVHIADILFDYNVAVQYYFGGKIIYFTWTICLIIIPSLINVIVSERMQYQDRKRNSNTDMLDDHKMTMFIRIKSILYSIITILLQLTPLIHYYKTLKYGLKVRKCEKSKDHITKRRYYLMMLKEDQDVALLRIFECFLEAAPQQILQLTLMLKHHNEINFQFVHQVGSIVSSFIGMAWTMASYHRSIRLAQQDKSNIGLVGIILQFLLYFFITVARILSLSVIISIWPVPSMICCIIHWLSMTIWILIDSYGVREFCRNYNRPPHMKPTFKERIYTILFAIVIGIVHIFIYLNTVDSKTFWKHVCFYAVCFIENITSILLWQYTSPPQVKNAWYFNIFLIISVSSFFLGITAMILYYSIFHPSKKQCISSAQFSEIQI